MVGKNIQEFYHQCGRDFFISDILTTKKISATSKTIFHSANLPAIHSWKIVQVLQVCSGRHHPFPEGHGGVDSFG